MSLTTKKELVREVQLTLESEAGLQLSQDKIKKVLSAYSTTIANELTNGSEVRIDSVGTLLLKEFKATTGRNLQTGARIEIPATKRVKFRPVVSLKKAVKELAVAA